MLSVEELQTLRRAFSLAKVGDTEEFENYASMLWEDAVAALPRFVLSDVEGLQSKWFTSTWDTALETHFAGSAANAPKRRKQGVVAV